MTATAGRANRARSAGSTLSQRMAAAADRAGSRGVTFAHGDHVERVSWPRLHEEARAVAGELQRRGAGPGSHVALLGTNSRPLVTAVLASWLAGAAVVLPPLPLRLGSLEEFVEQTRRRIDASDASLSVLDPALADLVERRAGDPLVVTLDELCRSAGLGGDAGRRAERFDPLAVAPDTLAILQFTSGSTADPKCVMQPHRQVGVQIDGSTAAAAFDAENDVMVSWLPLYHDMGLVGFLAVPACTGTELVIGSPQEFTASPRRWLEWLSEFRATITAGPSFAYALASRAARSASGLDLSRMRIALNGAEPIDPDAVDTFCESTAPFGFRPGAVFCAFGMAEATLAVSFPKPGEGMRSDVVDRRVLEEDKEALPVAAQESGRRQRRLAILGRPIPGLDVRIVEPEGGTELGPRSVGELELRGDCITPGYYRNPDATRAVFHGEWLRTGDLGYLVDGELVVCGRSTDMIIFGGRNIYPEDIERAVSKVRGVRSGNVIAFGIEGRKNRERMVVVAESKDADPEEVRAAAARQVTASSGLPAADIVVVEPGSLPKTSSGKLQRSRCRQSYLRSELSVLAGAG